MVQYFTVGPSQLHPRYTFHYQQALEKHIGSISHRSAAFRSIYQHTEEQLRALLGFTQNHRIYFTPSATEIWERILMNLVESQSFHFVNGSFSKRFFEFSGALGKKNLTYEVEQGLGFEHPEQVELPEGTELICTTQNETSSGIQMPVTDLVKLKAKHPTVLLVADIVSSAPYPELDFTRLDSAFFSVQKGFGMPPGLGVWILNDACVAKAEEVSRSGKTLGAHHTIEAFEKNRRNWETPSTPNTVAIYILGKIAEDMNRIGIETIRKETNEKFKLLQQFEQQHEDFSYTTPVQEHLSRTVAVFRVQENPTDLLQRMKQNGYVLAGGYGKNKDQEIRIANFPWSTVDDMQKMLTVLGQGR